MTDTGAIDFGHDDSNMYGCLPCPECKSPYRVPYRPGSTVAAAAEARGIDISKGVVQCDACGYTEPITSGEENVT